MKRISLLLLITLLTISFTVASDIGGYRLWNDADDFNNGTIKYNISTTNDKIELEQLLPPADYYFNLSDKEEYYGQLTTTNVNSVTFGTGKINNSGEWTADTLDEISLGNNPRILHAQMWNDTTVSVWLKSTSYNFGSGDSMQIIDARPNGAGGCSNNHWSLYVKGNCSNDACDNTARLKYTAISYNSGGGQNSSSNRDIEDDEGKLPAEGEWFHVTLVHDNFEGTQGGEIRIYLNGNLTLNQTYTTQIQDYTKTSPACEYTIGSRSSNTQANWANTWDGNIDEIYVGEYAMTEEQVKANYNAGSGRTAPIDVRYDEGHLDDLQSWCPQTNYKIANITINQTKDSEGIIFKFNNDNSTYTNNNLTSDGDNFIDLTSNFDSGECIYYTYYITDKSSINSYYINELYLTPTLDVTTDMINNSESILSNLTINYSGTKTNTNDIFNCSLYVNGELNLTDSNINITNSQEFVYEYPDVDSVVNYSFYVYCENGDINDTTETSNYQVYKNYEYTQLGYTVVEDDFSEATINSSIWETTYRCAIVNNQLDCRNSGINANANTVDLESNFNFESDKNFIVGFDVLEMNSWNCFMLGDRKHIYSTEYDKNTPGCVAFDDKFGFNTQRADKNSPKPHTSYYIDDDFYGYNDTSNEINNPQHNGRHELIHNESGYFIYQNSSNPFMNRILRNSGSNTLENKLKYFSLGDISTYYGAGFILDNFKITYTDPTLVISHNLVNNTINYNYPNLTIEYSGDTFGTTDNIFNCSLYINNVLNETQEDVNLTTTQQFIQNYGNDTTANYNYKIFCENSETNDSTTNYLYRIDTQDPAVLSSTEGYEGQTFYSNEVYESYTNYTNDNLYAINESVICNNVEYYNYYEENLSGTTFNHSYLINVSDLVEGECQDIKWVWDSLGEGVLNNNSVTVNFNVVNVPTNTTITSISGGETFYTNDSITINWTESTFEGSKENVTYLLEYKTGVTWYEIANITEEIGYIWNMPDMLSSSNYNFKITTQALYNDTRLSDSYITPTFNIYNLVDNPDFTSHNNNDWEQNEIFNLSWTTETSGLDTVIYQLTYSLDNSTFNLLYDDVNPIYEFNTSNLTDGLIYFKLTARNSETTSIETQLYIKRNVDSPTVDITYPNGGESLYGQSVGNYNITFDIVDEYSNTSTVNLKFSTNNGSTWETITTDSNILNDEYYEWNISNITKYPHGNNYLVNLEINDGLYIVNDSSDITFNIIQNTAPTIDSITILNQTAYTNTNLVGECNASDDGQIQMYGFEYRWFINEVDTLISSIMLNSTNFNKSDDIVFRCSVYDGQYTTIENTSITILNSIPSNLVINTPINESLYQTHNITFTYEAEDLDEDELNYEVYFGTDKNSLSLVQNSTSTNYNFYKTDNTYYFKIIVSDSFSSVESDIYNFRIDVPSGSSSNYVSDCESVYYCSNYGLCEDGFTSRTCIDLNNCEEQINPPEVLQECTLIQDFFNNPAKYIGLLETCVNTNDFDNILGKYKKNTGDITSADFGMSVDKWKTQNGC